MSPRILVHGGAGFWRTDIRRAVVGVRSAASAGSKILIAGGSAIDAVEAAVSAMEDDPTFNAGKGSSLTFAGTIEMDAAIMDGRDLSAGAVALIRKVKNPIQLARLVMENTDHVLLAGRTAENLAKAYSLPMANPITLKKRRQFIRMKRGALSDRLKWVRKNPQLLRDHPEIPTHDTVGAVAVDSRGSFAAAASTGGTMMKLPGRIGDTPQVGSGIYSDNQSGAATATGVGEIAVRLTLSREVCARMEQGFSAKRAAEGAIMTASKRLKGEAGVIAIDVHCRIAVVHNTPYLPWGFWADGMPSPKAASHGRIVSRLRYR